jgi:hypothetical protein
MALYRCCLACFPVLSHFSSIQFLSKALSIEVYTVSTRKCCLHCVQKPSAILGIVNIECFAQEILWCFRSSFSCPRLSHNPCFSADLICLAFNEKLLSADLICLAFNEKLQAAFALHGLYLFKIYSIFSLLLSTEQKVALPLSVFLVLPKKLDMNFEVRIL